MCMCICVCNFRFTCGTSCILLVPFRLHASLLVDEGMHSLVVGRIRKAAGMKGSGTPLLLNDNGEIIGSDSFACARHLGVLDESLVTILDTDVGPRTRSIAYSHLLKPGEGQSTLDAACFAAPQVSWWQRAVWSVGFLRRKVYEMMHGGMVRNDEYIEKCRERLRSALIKIEPLLSEPDFALPTNGDSKEQVGPTVSGIAVASLMYPVIWPPEVEAAVYGDAPHPTYEDMPQAMRDEIEQWRATPVGRWTLAYYAAYRLPSLEKARAVL